MSDEQTMSRQLTDSHDVVWSPKRLVFARPQQAFLIYIYIYVNIHIWILGSPAWNHDARVEVLTTEVCSEGRKMFQMIVQSCNAEDRLRCICTCNAWALPERCSVEGSHSQSNDFVTLHSIWKVNKGIGEFYWHIPSGSTSHSIGPMMMTMTMMMRWLSLLQFRQSPGIRRICICVSAYLCLYPYIYGIYVYMLV